MRIRPFTQGPPALVKRLNEIINVVNSVSNMTGDGMVQVRRSHSGMTLNMNPDRIAQFIPKVARHAESLKIAYCKTNPDSSTVIQAFLDTDLTGEEVEVVFLTVGNVGVGLDSMVPRLSLGQQIMVTSISGVWYCTTIFQESRNC